MIDLRGKQAYSKYIASLLLFGSNGIIAGQIALPSAEIVFWRTLIGSLLLFGLFCVRNRRRLGAATREIAMRRGDLLYILLSGMSMGISWIFLYRAYTLIGVSLSSLLYYCGPVIVMALSPLLFGEKLTPGCVIGFSIVFIGVLMANGAVGENVNQIGLTFGLGSAAAYALMVILNKKSLRIKGLENSLIQLACSFLTVMVYIAATKGFTLQISASDWGWLLVLGILNTGFGCYLYFSAMGVLSAQSVSVLGYLEPLSAVVLAVLLLGEQMTLFQWAGAALIIGGAVFGECFHGNARIPRHKGRPA